MDNVDNDSGGISSSRSKRVLKNKVKRNSAFERLKELRGSKNKYEVKDVENVYDVVEEKEYSKRRQGIVEEDWIVDDDGSGYVEDGREIFDDDGYDDNELFVSKSKKSTKGKRSASTASSNPTSSGDRLKRMFANMPTKKRKLDSQEMTDAEKMILEECLSEESPSIKPKPLTGAPAFTYERRKIAPPTKRLESVNKFTPDTKLRESSTHLSTDDRQPLKAINKQLEQVENTKEIKVEKSAVKSEVSDMDFDMENFPNDEDFLDTCNRIDKDNGQSDSTDLNKKMEPEKSIPRYMDMKSDVKTEKVSSSGWKYSTEIEEKQSASAPEIQIDSSKLPLVSNNDGDQVLRMFWLDAYEDYFNKPGVVYLFGKIFIESAKTHVSCCVTIKNIEKRVFLLPRAKKMDLKTKTEGSEVSMRDVYEEFNNLVAKKFKIDQFKSKPSTKKYAFEKPGVPKEAQYMEVRYPAKYPSLPQTLEGETFSHVFGSNTSSLELLLLDRKLKGPGWIDVRVPEASTPPISWCKIEAVTMKPENITPVKDIPPPPLSVVSLSFRTVINPKSKQNEICLVSCLSNPKFHINKPSDSQLFQDHWCAVSKPVDSVLPYDFKTKLLSYKGTKVEKSDTEAVLLGFVLAKLFKTDPDIVIGHDIFGFDLSVLLHRIHANKIPLWSRIGRLRRKEMPKLTSKGLAERQAACGRLICDAKISAKELIRAKSYDLGPLVAQVLRPKEGERAEYSTEDVKKCFSSSEEIFSLINATMQDAFYCLKIVSELNVLPLALQITNIAGNLMSRTLLGGRSERNEYLLLHAFNEKGYICPDKQYKSKGVSNFDSNDESGSKAKGEKAKGKSSYEGGLVLEPKKGFYDTLILLMDFNSLYPSIIQEYNICFTTVPLVETSGESAEEMLPDLPDEDVETGILPNEIRKLVQSRREVKKMMKASDISPEQKQQCDIRQKALKLTANSMYGCLGFSHSRFYARHLASLITAKGREILLSTKDLVQKLNFDVIYGDTDSIMINTNCVDYEHVFKLGGKIKSEVNKLYKQLELDIDGVFKYMLLLKKKKYAAVTISKSPDGDIILEKELKGLDIVRRDWSEIAADTGKVVLDQILSDQGPDERIDNIHSQLEKIRDDLNEGRVNMESLAITKQLTKSPSDYPDKNSLPHVQVALRMNSKESKRLRQGDTVPYVICQDGSSLSAVHRAYHVDEVKTNPELKIDINYYLSQQIHPVVSRLCDPIEGTDSARIAECLGLDPAGYRSRTGDQQEAEEDYGAEELTEEETFRLCQRFSFKCPSPDCQLVVTMDAPTRGSGSSTEFLLQSCPDPKCKTPLYKHVNYIQNRLRKEVRTHIANYYSCWMMCEEPSCGSRTRCVPLQFVRGFPICPVCRKGTLCREFTECHLYEQLRFYSYIFDHEKGFRQNKELKHVDEYLKRAYICLKAEVDTCLKHNGYSVIDLASIFAQLYHKPNRAKAS